MSEPERALPKTPQERIDAMRRDGSWRLDPARFRYLEALARRIESQPAPVRQLLQDRLQLALTAHAEQIAKARQAAAEEAQRLLALAPRQGPAVRRLLAQDDLRGMRRLALRAAADAMHEPLAQLNQQIRALARSGSDPMGPGASQEQDELASVQRFRRSWSRSQAQARLARAAARRPAHAGPLNSHVLALQSLERMGELSPHYLERFLSYVESLQWLEQAAVAEAPNRPRAARRKR